MTNLSLLRAAMPCAASLCALSSASLAAPSYTLVGQYSVASGLAGVDVLPDGRLVGVRADGVIVAQAAANSSSWGQIGAIDASLLNPFGPSFLAASPDGSRLAIGDGNFGAGSSVLLVEVNTLDPMSISAASSVALANYAGRWANNDTLFVSGAAGFSGGIVSQLSASTLSTRTVIDSIDGASGGVITDGTWLYTGNGFAFDSAPGSSQTGEVRAFLLTDLANGAAPLSFESAGIAVADALSAASLAIDALGNLVIGGAEFGGGESGFFAVIGADLLSDALAGAGIVPDSLELRLDPSGGGAFAYSVLFNSITGETIAISGGTAYRFAIPAPGAGLPVLATGLFVAGRRRRERSAA